MLVTSVVGHMMDVDFTGAAKSWGNFPLRDLFSAQISKSVKSSLEPVKNNIKALMNRCDTLVLWLDCDREGENIGFEVIQIAQEVRPHITVKRAHFSALTPRDIQHAADNLREPDRWLSEAVEARQEMDLRIGAAFTRFQTLRLRENLKDVSGVVSFGPCQFPTLGFVVRREWERSGFVAEDYFTMHLSHEKTHFTSSRGSMFDQLGATLLLEDMITRSQTIQYSDSGGEISAHHACVTQVNQREQRRRPPPPLATVAMQKLASTHLRISSEQCMKLAESLYQEGFLSYPRTETDHFTFTERELLDFAALQVNNREVGGFAAQLVEDPSHRFRKPLSGGHDDKAHPPIHPTKLYEGSPADDKYKLYMLVVRHFLACVSPDAVDAKTTVSIRYGGEDFTTSGTAVVEKGWTEVFSYNRSSSTTIPNYRLHETFRPTAVRLDKSVTAAPPRLTETALISVMDENGIGTDATIAQHIKTLVDRQYMKREGQSMVPTPLGMALAAAYQILGLASLLQPQLRAQMEAAMGDIVARKATRADVVRAAVGFYSEVFDRLNARGDDFLRLVGHYYQQYGGSPGAGSDAAAGGRGPYATNHPGAVVRTDTRVVREGFGMCGRCRRPLQLVSVGNPDAGQQMAQCVPCNLQLRLPNSRYANLSATSTVCPICQFSVVQAENTERQSSYSFCVHCFSKPPRDFSSDVESMGDLRCYQCLHPRCPLAKGREQLSIMKCISCGVGELKLRRSPNGVCLACAGHSECHLRIGLPTASSVEPNPQQRCQQCRSVMLTFNFHGVQPVPGLEEVETICVYCDRRVEGYLTIIHPGAGAARATRADALELAPSPAPAAASAQQQQAYVLPSIRSLNAPRPPAAAPSFAGPGTSAVNCNCGVPAKQLVSRKENSSGRPFRTCASRKCGFFEWCD